MGKTEKCSSSQKTDLEKKLGKRSPPLRQTQPLEKSACVCVFNSGVFVLFWYVVCVLGIKNMKTGKNLKK